MKRLIKKFKEHRKAKVHERQVRNYGENMKLIERHLGEKKHMTEKDGDPFIRGGPTFAEAEEIAGNINRAFNYHGYEVRRIIRDHPNPRRAAEVLGNTTRLQEGLDTLKKEGPMKKE